MKTIDLTLKIWRQSGPTDKGRFETHELRDISTDMSFLEMLDILNERLTLEDKEPVAFDHDCREGICGMCGAVVNGRAHGPLQGTTLCQLHMRNFKNNDTIIIEPFRARPFKPLKDLVVDRGAFDVIIQAGGYVSVGTGGIPDANTVPVPAQDAELAFAAANCVGCGACVASCPNASAMLFVGAKVSHLALMPQGKTEAKERAIAMVRKMDELGFGNCTNFRECEAVCPKEISIVNIARLNREYLKAALFSRQE